MDASFAAFCPTRPLDTHILSGTLLRTKRWHASRFAGTETEHLYHLSTMSFNFNFYSNPPTMEQQDQPAPLPSLPLQQQQQQGWQEEALEQQQLPLPPPPSSSTNFNPADLPISDPDLFEALSDYLALGKADPAPPPPSFTDDASNQLPSSKRARSDMFAFMYDPSPGDISVVVPGLVAPAVIDSSPGDISVVVPGLVAPAVMDSSPGDISVVVPGLVAPAVMDSSPGDISVVVPGLVAPAPDASASVTPGNSGSGGGGGRSLSAQTLAARERRRKISDRMQELGRLVPGGQKMNSAEMLQAAFTYVKFMQAQAGILGVMDQQQAKETGEPSSQQGAEQLPALLTSMTVQEKLSAAEQCIVPTGVVEKLAEDQNLKSSPSVSRELGRLIEEMRNLKAPPPP